MQKHGRDAYLAELKRSQPYLEFLLERAAAAHNLTREDSRREFLQQMLAVAARIPDPATRDQFADRLAHKARVTEEVVRGEIRKAAAARSTTLPARMVPAATHVTDTERGLLWAILHHARGRRRRPFDSLQPADLEGLASEIAASARRCELAAGDPRGVAKCAHGASNRKRGADAGPGRFRTAGASPRPECLRARRCRTCAYRRELSEIERRNRPPGRRAIPGRRDLQNWS